MRKFSIFVWEDASDDGEQILRAKIDDLDNLEHVFAEIPYGGVDMSRDFAFRTLVNTYARHCIYRRVAQETIQPPSCTQCHSGFTFIGDGKVVACESEACREYVNRFNNLDSEADIDIAVEAKGFDLNLLNQ